LAAADPVRRLTAMFATRFARPAGVLLHGPETGCASRVDS